MSRDLNQVTEIGRLTRDVELKYTPSGTACAKFSIAVNEQIKSGNDYKDYVNYFDVVVWGNMGVNCEKYLKKGSQVCVSGSLKQQRWTDNQSNQTRSRVEIVAQTVQFIGSQPGQNTAKQNEQAVNSSFNADPWNDSDQPPQNDKDIPF